MEYISVKEAARLWGIDTSRVGRLAREGRIEGARLVGRNWLIPKAAQKPADGRTRKVKTQTAEDFFRFPVYINRREKDFFPPLSEEENALRAAQMDFMACNFSKAEEEFYMLKEAACSYVRMAALFHLCLLSASAEEGRNFKEYYTAFELSLSGAFPHKTEMELFHACMFASLTMYKNAGEKFTFLPGCGYVPEAFPIMSFLSFIKAEYSVTDQTSAAIIDIYEIEVKRLENGGYIPEAMLLHIAMVYHYFMRSNKVNESMIMFHIKKAVSLAYENNYIYPVADAFVYYKAFFEPVLTGYPEEFRAKIIKNGEEMYKSFSSFALKTNITDIYNTVSNGELIFIIYAAEGYSFKEIADRMHISHRTVASRFAEIYGKLGVSGKRELLDMVNAVSSNKTRL